MYLEHLGSICVVPYRNNHDEIHPFINLSLSPQPTSTTPLLAYRRTSDIRRNKSQKLKCLSSRLAVVFAQLLSRE